jgi:hypothetical protein
MSNTQPRGVTLLKPGIPLENWVSPERIALTHISAQYQNRIDPNTARLRRFVGWLEL